MSGRHRLARAHLPRWVNLMIMAMAVAMMAVLVAPLIVGSAVR